MVFSNSTVVNSCQHAKQIVLSCADSTRKLVVGEAESLNVCAVNVWGKVFG